MSTKSPKTDPSSSASSPAPAPAANPQQDAAHFTNQQLIDALYNAARGQEMEDWALLEKAGLDLAELAGAREAPYAGEPIDTLGGLSDGERAWVLEALAAEIDRRKGQEARATTVRVTAPAGLNLRSAPGADQPVVRLLAEGTLLTSLKEAGEWLLVSTTAGERGYVFREYVAVADGQPDQPGRGNGKVAQGYLAADAALRALPLAPEAGQQVQLAPDAGPGARLLATIWNTKGNLLNALAERLAIDPATAVAVLAVESRGEGYGDDGRMIIRFENHLFFANWGRRDPARFANHFTFNPERQWQDHLWRPVVEMSFREFHGSQPDEWQVLDFARSIDDTAAKLSISMGAPQILGSNHQRIGYPTVQAMFDAFAADERSQLLGLFDFVRADPALVLALQSGDFTAFARRYNGPGQAETYGRLIQDWVTAFDQLRPAPAGAAALPRPVEELTLAPALDASLTVYPEPRSPEVYMQTVPADVASAALQAAPSSVQPAALPVPKLPVDTDPEVRRIWLEHVDQGFKNNNVMFKRVLRAFIIPYYLTVALYVVLFLVGIGLFAVAARLSANEGTMVAGLLFGGLGVVTFLAFFIRQPARALEENLQFITWLGIIYNSYWTRLLYIENSTTVQAELEDATQDAIDQIEHMLERNAEFAGRRPGTNLTEN